MHHIYKDYYPGNIVVPVLKDVNLNVEEGEYLAIMGPSGSGKSTLMNIIGCLDKPTKGDFKLDGLDILNLSENALADVRLKKLGFVFQNFQLLPRQTAVENVALPLIYAGVGKRERLKRAAAALDKVGLSDRINFVPNQLSGGQKQRVAIARAMDLFTTLNQEGVTVIMITHDSHVAGFAKRRVDIFDGEISEYKPQEVTL